MALKQEEKKPRMAIAILGDVHFWVPAVALLLGLGLLVALH